MKYFKILSVFFLIFLFSGCSNTVRFERGDKKDDFCGPHINFQYCKCANHGEYCKNIGMSRGEAKDYVDKKYDKWVEDEKQVFAYDCRNDNGVYENGKCTYCDEGEIALGGDCVAEDEADEYGEQNDEYDNEDNEYTDNNEEKGECRFDDDCDAVCEGNVAWKMGCNPRENICVKTFDDNCDEDIENFSGLSFPKKCADGLCVRDTEAINEMKVALQEEKQLWSDTVNAINATRLDLSRAMLDANKQCLNGIADMTNLLILEGATRIANVLAGGIPDVAKMTESAGSHAGNLLLENTKALSGSVSDYTGDIVNKVYAYGQGTPPANEEKKLKPHEYIKLNCGLYDYFKAMIAESDTEQELALNEARRVDALLKALP